MMEWKVVTQTNAIWWICLLLASLVSISRQEAPNQTVSLGDEGGAGSGPYSGESERVANGATPGDSLSGNKTFSFIRSGPTPVKEAPNASIEKLGQSLTRLEGSLGSLIQSFLAMQRSVSNLEQLQELLVLLLEDILKQTGNMVKSPKAIRTEKDYKEPDAKSSNESNEDDAINGGGVGGEADRSVNNNAPRGNGAGKVGDDDFSLASRPLGGSQNEPQSNIKGSKAEARPSWSPDKTSRETGSSGEDRSTSEDIDMVNAKPFLDQGRPAPQDKGPSRSPQWAEPMTIDRGNILAIFREAVSRLIARPPTADGQEFQQLRLLREDHREANALPAESPAESPPRIFEPLEVKTSERNFMEKHGREETLPVQVRLSHLSPVVSHGGPLDGPEKSTSPFLEDLSDIVGKEYSGERPTGMINNLELSDAMWGMTGNDSSEQVQSTSPSTVPENKTSFIRRIRRQAWDRIQFSFNNARQDSTPEVTTSLPLKTNITDQEKGLMSSPQNVSVGSNNSSQINVTDSLGYGEDLIWIDYDHLIDSLLKDLSDKLKEYQSHQMTGDVTIDRAVHELNKLIWMPSFDYGGETSATNGETSATNGTVIADIAQGSTNVSFVSQPMESYTKHLQFSPNNGSQLHTEKHGNSTYLIQAKKKIENYKAKQLGLEMQNDTMLKQQEIDYNQITNSTSEWTWIASVPSAMRMPETDLKWLTETLALLSQRQDLAKDMEEIARRAWEMSQKRLENRDQSRQDTNTAEVDKHDDLEDEDEEEGDISERRTSLNSINGGNSVASDNRKEVSNRLDEAIQEVINALKDSMQDGNTVTDQVHPKNPISRENVGITDTDSGLTGFHGQHDDTMEHDEGDSEDTSHEDRGHREVNGLHVGQIHLQRAGHRIATPEKNHMTFPTYLRHHREKRSRHKRLSGMLWRQLLQPQSPELRNQGGFPPLDEHPPTHQSRNNSVPYSNGLLSSYHHMYPYRRQLTNEPWGQRFLRPYGNPLGYANYMSHLGINNPNWIHQALEPDEPPANDVLGSMDVEDALAALFQRYWQRLFDVYSRSNPQTTTTEEPDHDGESITPSPGNPAGENEANGTSISSPATVLTTNTALSLPSNWQETANQTLKAI